MTTEINADLHQEILDISREDGILTELSRDRKNSDSRFFPLTSVAVFGYKGKLSLV
jgi:hypothetical protein